MSFNEATETLDNYLIEHTSQVTNQLGNGNMIRPFFMFLGENATENDLQFMFNGFRTCTCCNPHQGSVPVSYNSDADTPKIYGHKCNCTCRHNRRILNKAYNHMVQFNDL